MALSITVDKGNSWLLKASNYRLYVYMPPKVPGIWLAQLWWGHYHDYCKTAAIWKLKLLPFCTLANDAHPISITDPSDGETSIFSIIKSSHPALYPGVVLGKPEY